MRSLEHQRLFRRGKEVEVEFQIRCHDGRHKWILSRGKIIERDNEGRPVRLVGTHVDISDRKRSEEERVKLQAQVQHAQKLESLGVLAGGIAHDFNNLLMGILGNADLAMAELSPASPARYSVHEIETAARRAADLTKQMLAYSGKGKFVVEPVDISTLVEEMSHLLEVSISKKAILRYNFSPNLPAMEADATQIRQVIMNLITNASDALEEKSGVISVTTGAMFCDAQYLSETFLYDTLKEGYYVYVEVCDTGCGMDRQTVARVFEPFFTTKFTGRGLGMAAVLGIVRGHKGAIKIYSEPNRGTTFKVFFPACDQNVSHASRVETCVEKWNQSGAILVADDEETVRTLARRMLERLGFEVLLAGDGQEAVEIYRENRAKIRAVILDLTMPRLDGESAFRELRQVDPQVCVILSSGYNEQEVVGRFAGKGLAGFIQKPYQTEELSTKLKAALQ